MKAGLLIAGALAAALCAEGAVAWKNLDDASHLTGGKIAPSDLAGKVVLVYSWDLEKQESVDLLKNVEKTWGAFKTKKFMVVGSYVGAADVAKARAAAKSRTSFPVYHLADLDPSPRPKRGKPPFFCVVNQRGRVVYAAKSEKEATAALVDAIGAIGTPVNLCGDVTFRKFKSLEKQIALGRNVSSIVAKLEKESKSKDADAASEAREILAAVESAKGDVKADIEIYREADPAEAVKIIQLFLKTWPKDEDAAGYRNAISELKKAAAEKAKADKAKPKNP